MLNEDYEITYNDNTYEIYEDSVGEVTVSKKDNEQDSKDANVCAYNLDTNNNSSNTSDCEGLEKVLEVSKKSIVKINEIIEQYNK